MKNTYYLDIRANVKNFDTDALVAISKLSYLQQYCLDNNIEFTGDKRRKLDYIEACEKHYIATHIDTVAEELTEQFENSSVHDSYTLDQLADIHCEIAELYGSLDITHHLVDYNPCLARVKRCYLAGESIPVSCHNLDTTYLSPSLNAKLRAIHDIHHIKRGLTFTTTDEIFLGMLGYELSNDPTFQAFYRSEVSYQAAYYHRYQQFMLTQKVCMTNLNY